MTNNSQPHAPEDRDGKHYASRIAFTLCSGIAIYVLSFGPLFNLTTRRIGGGGYVLPAKFPTWAHTVNTVYAPLIHGLVSYPQPMQYRALTWYVRLCDFRPSGGLDYGDPKRLEADVNEAVAKMKKEIRLREGIKL